MSDEFIYDIMNILEFPCTNDNIYETVRYTEPPCPTYVDCHGVCDGPAIEDCNGECGGPSVEDCNGDCLGSAVFNDCGYCVGGETGRDKEFGRDECDNCISLDYTTYFLEVDCAGVCGGTAYYDDCWECVGMYPIIRFIV